MGCTGRSFRAATFSIPALTLTTALTCASAFASGATRHDRAFWRAIVQNHYAVPPGGNPAALLAELNESLGSPDPEWRDEFGYSIPAAWIYRQRLLSREQLRPLRERWMAQLRDRVGETGTDSVLRRSFSALDLSLIAALDLKQPVLDQTAFDALLTAALDYLAAEKDLRGYEAGKGWFHATAHTADLIKFLARSPHLRPVDQGRILAALAAKLQAAGQAFVFGENERMARAVASVVVRSDFDHATFSAWLDQFPPRAKALWSTPALDLPAFAAVQNAKDLLRSLFVDLAARGDLPPAARDARREVLECLEQMP